MLLVDAVEGVRSQTFNIIKQLFSLKLDVVLCINKVDRLFDELSMEPFDIFIKLLQLIADVNQTVETVSNQHDYFLLSKNVFVSSGYQGWGFSVSGLIEQLMASVPQLASADKEQFKEQLSQNDFVLTEQGVKKCSTQKPLIVQLVLEPIQRVYQMTKS